MRMPSGLVADLALLTDALDGVDVATTLTLLASDVATAVSSYAGLSLRLCSAARHVELTTLTDEVAVQRIVTSLRIPVPQPTAGPAVVIVLYATTPGAFVDMAADLAWLTGRALDDVGLDRDLGNALHAHPATSLRDGSTVDQAVGVLVSRGRTPEEASADLDDLALGSGSDRYAAARQLLAGLPESDADVTSDSG